MKNKPHIVMIIPRGEAVRNFVYSDTLRLLSQRGRVTVLSVVDEERVLKYLRPYVEEIIFLKEYSEKAPVRYMRTLIFEAHMRWLWSKVAQNRWEMFDALATTRWKRCNNFLRKALYRLFARRPLLEALTVFEQWLTLKLGKTHEFKALLKRLQPDIVFNCSHVHGPAGELPARVAYNMKITTVGFIFSWDNLTSRGRICVPYHHYFVWHEHMKKQLRSIYPRIRPERIHNVGTPQFDFHFKEEFLLSREKLCQKIGLDAQRPFVLYTTAIPHHFPEEHRIVEKVIRMIHEVDSEPKPQLVVRLYVKGVSPQMRALSQRGIADVVFPQVSWDKKWLTPLHEDLSIYTSLLRHCLLGINAASTVSLELLIHDKPVINLGFNPPGSTLPYYLRWKRHIEFDHFQPLARSKAVMVAYSFAELSEMFCRGLKQPEADSKSRQSFLKEMFGTTLDAHAGERIAQRLSVLASERNEKNSVAL